MIRSFRVVVYTFVTLRSTSGHIILPYGINYKCNAKSNKFFLNKCKQEKTACLILSSQKNFVLNKAKKYSEGNLLTFEKFMLTLQSKVTTVVELRLPEVIFLP